MLAAMAMLQLSRARIVTHEEVTLTSLRHVAKSCHFFLLVNQRYPDGFTELSTASPPYLTPDFIGTTVEKQGYVFTYVQGANGFTLRANPKTHGVTGERHFYTDQSLTIHATPQNRDADPTIDPVIP